VVSIEDYYWRFYWNCSRFYCTTTSPRDAVSWTCSGTIESTTISNRIFSRILQITNVLQVWLDNS
jgi:hypothetical protein